MGTGRGRVNSVISPMIQLASIASIASMALAGLLASTVLRGFHAVVAGVDLGRPRPGTGPR